jgi:hypothetical protein
MSPPIKDAQVQLLANISASLCGRFLDEDVDWADSPFGWIRTRPSRQEGAIGELLVEEWCRSRGLGVERAPDSDADRLVNGVRIEIKFSTLWKSGGYKFQQFRDQNYHLAICLGISPFDAHCWILPKSLILEKWGKAQGLTSQHGGQSGTDTAWLAVDPNAVHDWLRPQGGSLDKAFTILLSELGRHKRS